MAGYNLDERTFENSSNFIMFKWGIIMMTFKKIGSWRELSVSKILWYYWMIEPIMYQTLCYYVLGYIYDTHAWLQYAVMRTCAGAPS